MKEGTTSDTTSKSIPTQESASAPAAEHATGGIRSKLRGIFAGRKRQLRRALIVLGAVLLVFVIIPKIFSIRLSKASNLLETHN